MATTRLNFANLVVPGLDEVLYDEFESVPTQHDLIFPMDISGQKREVGQTVAGFGSMPQKDEGAPITEDKPYQGYQTTLTHLEYAMKFAITKTMWEDEQYGVMSGMSKNMGVAARDAKEVAAANIFNNGFSDSFVGGDSEPLFGDATNYDHPMAVGSTTLKNRLSSNADLTVSSLTQALIDIRGTVNDRGLLVVLNPATLIVPPELEMIAEQILGSDKEPFTADNQINAIRKRGLKLIVWDYLTDSDAWYVGCDKARTGLRGFNRIPLQTESGDDINTGNAVYTARQRFIFGWFDWRGIFGNPGA